MTKTSVSFALARFVFISCLGLAGVITTLVSYQVFDSMRIEYEKAANREISTLSNNYKVYISHHVTLLKEQAKMPPLIQGLMQPDANLGKTQDYMAELTLLGKKYNEILIDFDGNTVYATGEHVDFSRFTWMTDLLNEKVDSIVKVISLPEGNFWSIAVPVFYNSSIEGALVAVIPISAINVEQSNANMTNGLQTSIIKDNVVIASFGNAVYGTTRAIYWPEVGIKLSFTIDDSERYEALSSLVYQLSVLIVITIVLTTVLAYVYGYRYFVKPIIHLTDTTSNIEQGNEPPELDENLRFREFAGLYSKFNKMSQKILKREQALKQSYEKLSATNEELKQSETQLVQSEKMASIGVLAAGVAHEINNPIGFIRSNLQVLGDYFVDINNYYQEFLNQLDSDEAREVQKKLAKKHELEFIFNDAKPLVKASIGGVDRVAEIVNSLKTFARVDSPERISSDINEGVKATLAMVTNELKYKCRIHEDLSTLPKVMIFPGRLNQVFMNLLINAGQAITEKGDIYIRTFVEEGNVVIQIEDSGSGIDEENISQIFTPFYTSKPIGEGTGLGLSISHQIVEQHNGRIEVSSTKGKGSCFRVIIPIDET